MKVIYCNPIFLDYRLPFYKELNRLFNGQFYILFSHSRMIKGKALYDRIINDMGNNAIPFKGDRVFYLPIKSHGDIARYQRIPFVWGLLYRLYKEKPDILITEGYFQWTPIIQLYGFLTKTPVFMGYERTLYTERYCSSWKTRLRKFQNRFFAGFLVNGIETTKYLLHLGVDEKKIHIGGMSADSEGLKNAIAKMSVEEKDKERKQICNGKDGLIFLFTGFLTGRKGIIPLLNAWLKHQQTNPNDQLVIVGDGDLYHKCVEEFGSNESIHFEGRVPYTEIHKYYAIADVYILPTIEDNWSLVIPEAMACGLPVATSIYNGCHMELLPTKNDGVGVAPNGYVFDTFQQETLLAALDHFHHVDLSILAEQSVRLEEHFNTTNSAKREYNGIMSYFTGNKKN